MGSISSLDYLRKTCFQNEINQIEEILKQKNITEKPLDQSLVMKLNALEYMKREVSYINEAEHYYYGS